MAKKKVKRKVFKQEEILRILCLLEANDMNMASTAREVGVDRSCISKWKKRYWDFYLERKNEVNDQVRDIEAIKFSTVKEFEELKDVCTKALRLALDRSITILSDPDAVILMTNKDLTEFIKVIAPYAAEKVGLSGSEPPSSPFERHTTFVQNIIQQLNIKGIKNMRNDNKQNQV